MDFSIEKDINTLLVISKENCITSEHAKITLEIINRYFTIHQRNQAFQKVENLISMRFGEILSHFDLNNGTIFASSFFLFCYTLLDIENFFVGKKNDIYHNVAIPFQKWVMNKGKVYSDLISTIPSGNDYVLICRRAMVTGMYAPGKSVYTYAEALLSRGENVWIIALWNSDPQFINLKRKYKSLKVSVLFSSNIEVTLISLIEILKLIEPKVILTETEFDLPSILGILKSKIPTIYLAQGYYNLPWYDSIGLNTNIDKSHSGRDLKDFFNLPVWISRDILAPEIDMKLIDEFKVKLGINKVDFVVGLFARMEKFSDPFLDFLYRLLDRDKRIKVLLAGPNNQSKVITKLKRFIDEKRAIILGTVDVNILGHCIDLGVDTFPFHSGYSVLELMAKNIPVISKRDDSLGSLIKDRLPETLKNEENELESLVIELINDRKLLKRYKMKTDEFMSNHDKRKEFLNILDDRISILENKVTKSKL